jgi:hypothetical protein
MSILSDSKLQEIEKNCKLILENDNIEFIGVINNMGNLIAGGFRKGVVPVGTEEIRKMMYMQLKLDLNMRKDYDSLYGPVNYVVSKRSKSEKITIPIGNYMVLLIANLNFNDDSKIKEIISVFKSSLIDSKLFS